STSTATLTATDAHGNTNTAACVVTFTARDNENPVITSCPSSRDISMNSGSCDITVPDLVSEATASDNCTYTITQSPAAGTVVPSSEGSTSTVTVTATDAHGNTNTAACVVTLTARDNENPVITSCPSSRDISMNSGSCDITVPDLVSEATASDNCTYTITQSPAAGTVVP